MYITIDPASNCQCKSGKLFTECCGSMAADRAPPADIQVHTNALSEANCNAILQAVKKRPKSWLEAVAINEHTGQAEEKRDPARVTKMVDLGDSLQGKINGKVGKLWQKYVAKPHKQPLAWYETPTMLCYTKGGKFDLHADSEAFNGTTQQWEYMLDRDFSMLLYINDDFEGGAVNFPTFNYRYQPKKGDLVIFPSNRIYMHEAAPVAPGTRYAIVSWTAFAGTPKKHAEPPANALDFDAY